MAFEHAKISSFVRQVFKIARLFAGKGNAEAIVVKSNLDIFRHRMYVLICPSGLFCPTTHSEHGGLYH